MSKLRQRIFFMLVAVGFVIGSARIVQVRFRISGIDDNRKVVRLGHNLLQSGVRDALQDVINAYEQRHPDVHVVQVPVPASVYLQFMRTQLVAGTAPDILQMGSNYTGMEEMRARYFRPITRWVDEPNPYNAGTELADRSWRDTFVDGLSNPDAYSEALRHYYGIPLTMSGVRIFYNRPLLQKISGSSEMPDTLEGLIALCQKVEAYARLHDRALVPFAGSRMSALFLMSPLVSSVSQRLYYNMTGDHTLRVTAWGYGLAYLQGRWSFDTPAIRCGFALARQLAQYQKPGFYQLSEDDAALQFLQQQALMITAYVLDANNLKTQANFAIGVALIPAITPADSVYGADVLGPVSELSNQATANLGVTYASKYPAEALDFLRFLGSKPGMEIFSRRSNWLPSVIDVPVSAWMKPMEPVLSGYAGRFFAEYAGKGDARFVIGKQLYRLFGPGGSLSDFLAAATRDYGPAIRTDLLKETHDSSLNLLRQEPDLLSAYLQGPTDTVRDQYWRDISAQNAYEADMLRTRSILARTASARPK